MKQPWRMPLRGRLPTLAQLAGVALLVALPLLFSDDPYYLNTLIETYLFAGLAMSWNLIGGLGGQLSLGHAVFFGIGAYTTSVLYQKAILSPLASLVAGAGLASVVALATGVPTFRLRGPFFTIATIAVNQVAFTVVNKLDLFGGPRGILIPFRPSWLNLMFRSRVDSAYLALVYLALAALVVGVIRSRRFGYWLMALREDEDAARAAGVSVTRVKLVAMVVSAALTSLGGSVYACYTRFVDPPSAFSLIDVGFRMVLITILGGAGTVAGPILGSFAVVPAATYLRGSLAGSLPGLHQVAFGLLLVVTALYVPQGIVGTVRGYVQRLDRVTKEAQPERAAGRQLPSVSVARHE